MTSDKTKAGCSPVPLDPLVGRKWYLVRHPRWHGAPIALFAGQPRDWENFGDSGRVSASVADAMVLAGIAEWASAPPNKELTGAAPIAAKPE